MKKIGVFFAALFCLFSFNGCDDFNEEHIYFYTVKFDSQGGTSVSPIQNQMEGTQITLPSPSRNGYVFGGWYSSESGGTKYGDGGSSYTITGNITMYARWNVKITFDSQGGASVPSITGAEGSIVELPATTKENYPFIGWYSKADGGERYESPYTLTDNVTMYARWTFTLTFNSQGGSSVQPIKGAEGSIVNLPPAPSRAGYTFGGWYNSSSGGTKYESPHSLTGDVTMYARWLATITLTFDSRGGEDVPSITGAPSTSVELPVPTRSGYVFAGWYSAIAEFETKHESPYTLTSSVTMYARWLVDLGANGSGNDGDEMTINGIECVLVKAGKFIMGGSYFGNSETQQVTLTKDFCISKYPITNAQYGNSNSNANHPVVNVNWSQADTWAKSKGGQLPTEAQWEFAARGGNKSEGYIYSGSNTIGDVAWYSGNNSPNGTKAVGQKLPNELGIYDMSGNVWEWCSDWYGGYSSSAVTDPTGPSTGGNRV